MFSTTEVRWFYPGDFPPQIQTWFGVVADEIMDEASREDVYLLNTLGGRFGIKLRGGLLEVKERTHTHGHHTFTPGVIGILESWVKLSFPLAAMPNSEGWPSSWVAVKKTRQLSPIKRHNSNSNCFLELTNVEVLNQHWWTLGLEAFGSIDRNHKHLMDSASQVFSSSKPPVLEEGASIGYPTWLDTVAKDR